MQCADFGIRVHTRMAASGAAAAHYSIAQGFQDSFTGLC